MFMMTTMMSRNATSLGYWLPMRWHGQCCRRQMSTCISVQRITSKLLLLKMSRRGVCVCVWTGTCQIAAMTSSHQLVLRCQLHWSECFCLMEPTKQEARSQTAPSCHTHTYTTHAWLMLAAARHSQRDRKPQVMTSITTDSLQHTSWLSSVLDWLLRTILFHNFVGGCGFGGRRGSCEVKRLWTRE